MDHKERVEPEWRNDAWSAVFSAAVEGVKQPPEEPGHKAVRFYGIFCGEMSTAADNLGSSFADAGYVAADILSAVDTLALMSKEGVLSEGLLKDVKEAVKKIEDGQKDFDKDDCEDAFNSIMNMSDKILEEVVDKCKSAKVGV